MGPTMVSLNSRWSLPLAIGCLGCLVLLCACDPCSGGTMSGKCGLEGVCVDCIVDADCTGAGEVCAATGTCVVPKACTLSSDCDGALICEDGECQMHCVNDSDCYEGARCDGTKCYTERCTEDGVCPEGWAQVHGTLACLYFPGG
jgi:hypothetical protein